MWHGAGSFYIRRNEIIQLLEHSADDMDDFGLINIPAGTALQVFAHVLNIVVPEVSAADISSSPDGDFILESENPHHQVYHNNNTSSNTGRVKWWTWFYYDTDGGGDDTQGLELRDRVNEQTIIDIQPGTDNHNAVQYFGDGKIHWANGSMALDKAEQKLTIGATGGSAATLSLFGVRPSIMLADESNNDRMWYELDLGKVTLFTSWDGGNSWSKPSSIDVGAPDNSFKIDVDGKVGFGTASPLEELHIVDHTQPAIRLEKDGSLGPPYTWDIGAGELGLFFRDVSNAFALPFWIRAGAPSFSIYIASTGDVGIGTDSPAESLHVKRDDGSAKFLVEEINATQSPRTLFEIKNKGNPEFRMTNTGNANSWLFSAGLRFVVKNNAGDWVSRVDAAGNMEITGSLTTTGGTCGGGCDLLFHPDTKIESIEEHATAMWANSYLPAVGPTIENEPFNLTEKTGGMLNELEKAHVYIEQLHKRLAEQDQRHEKQYAELKAMMMALQRNSQHRLSLNSL